MKLKRDNGGFRLSKNRFIGAENLKRFSRAETPLKPKEDKNSDHFILSVASETAIWRDYWQAWEKIIVSEQTLDLRFLSSQRSPILYNHNLDELIGVNERIWIENAILYSLGRFKQGQHLEDIRNGFLNNISFGYSIKEAHLEEAEDGEEMIVADLVEVHEVSIVTLPADTDMKVEQSIPSKNQPKDSPEEDEEDSPEEKEENRQAGIAHLAERENIPQWRVSQAIRSGEAIESFISYCQSQREEPISHYAPADKINQSQRQIGGNEMRLETLYPDNQKGKGKADTGNWRNLSLGLSQRDRANYSLGRLLAYQAGYDVPKPELELEASRALGEKMNKQARGAWIPLADLSWQRRDAALGTNFNGGGSLVETSLGEFVDLLRSRLVLGQMGITVLSGLSGNLDLPRMDQASTVQWISESELIPETDVSFDVVEYRPRTIASRTPITRRLLIQSAESLDVEMELRQDLVRSIAIELDRAAVNGSGIGNEPLGLMNNSDVPEVSLSGSSVAWSDVVSMESQVALNNADINRLHYLMDPTTRGTLKTTSVDAGSGEFIFNNLEQVDPNRPGATGTVNGYLSFASTTVPQKALLFGNWADLVFAEFGVMDIASSSTGRMFPTGGVEVRAMMDVDIKPRRPYSFAKISNINP